MSFFSFLFGSSKSTASKKQGPAPYVLKESGDSSANPGQPDLIRELESDHRALFKLCDEISASFANRDLQAVADGVRQFEVLISRHLVKENTRLYLKMERDLTDEGKRDSMRKFRMEMNQLSPVVMDFLGKYKKIAAEPELASTFEADFKGLGEALDDRTRREEAFLYPMYSA